MIKRPTLIMLGALVIVLAFAWYWESTKDERQSASATPTVMVENLFPFNSAEITKLTIEDAAGGRVVLRRAELGGWVVSEPQGQSPTDIGAVESAVTQLADLRVARSLEPMADLTIFGLSEPLYTITVVLQGSQMHILKVGDVNQAGNSYYVQLNDQDPQLVNKFSLDPVLSMVANPPFQPTATPTIGFTPEITSTLTIEATPVLTTTVTP